MTLKLVNIDKIHNADLESIGYSIGASGDTSEQYARELVRRYPTGELTDEAMAGLERGLLGRKAELVGDIHYIHEDNVYTKTKDAKQANFVINVPVAMGYSTYEFGKLESNLKAIVKPVRDDAKKYISNRLNPILNAVAKLVSGESSSRSRSPNKRFDEAGTTTLAALWKRCKTAHGKGDPSATNSKAEFVKMVTDFANKV